MAGGLCGSVKHWCSNERNWLIALNAFIMVSGVALGLFAVYLTTLISYHTIGDGEQSSQGERSAQALLNTWVALAVLSFLQAVAAVVGMVAAAKIRIHAMMAYFWAQSLILLAMILFGIAALDFQQQFAVWMRHHWTDNGMSEVRKTFCQEGTWDNKCTVPITGYPYATPAAWCQAEQDGATDCAEIQQKALDAAKNVVRQAMNIAGAVAIVSVAEMIAAMFLTVRLVTVPIIMRSMQSVINYLMLCPVVASIVVGWFMGLNDNLYKHYNMMDELHLFCGVVLLVCAFFGAAAGLTRHRRLLQIYIAGLSIVLFFYILLVGLSFYVYATLDDTIAGFSPEEAAKLACDDDFYQCCCCEKDPTGLYEVPACPEWTSSEMADIAKVFLKLGALTTLLCSVFVMCGLLASLVLYSNLKGYRCAYV
eukprot:TRINITY_DN1409_c0_g1_i1.p1 TRINITY_DN1409_c0_g1~~TRINITY_DN1409_c0_g1_i1.p1  ORF type:complete len:422 (+),score=119.76 TRINITY_DN1409_c0_g1_i1:62-1327(+)